MKERFRVYEIMTEEGEGLRVQEGKAKVINPRRTSLNLGVPSQIISIVTL